MPDKLTISNTSPLLYLHLVRQLDLLVHLYNKVFVPPTVGVILKAKEVGLLSAVSPVISALREARLWLSDALVADVLHQAKEK